MIEEFGTEDAVSSLRSWNYSPLYSEEMGPNLKWLLVGYSGYGWPEDIWKWKLFTNSIEKDFSRDDGSRRINIDPGYIQPGNIILASTKKYGNRVYIREGIFADITLFYDYKEKVYTSHELTFPEYKTRFARAWFAERRDTLNQCDV